MLRWSDLNWGNFVQPAASPYLTLGSGNAHQSSSQRREDYEQTFSWPGILLHFTLRDLVGGLGSGP
jgi:hypothetical protein